MRSIKGPAIFLAQFAGDAPPFNSLKAIAGWAAGLGFKGVQIPSWDARLFDLAKAAESQTYCDEIKGILAERGLQVTELSTHLQGQLVAVHPAYDTAFDAFAAPEVRGKPAARTAWAVEQVKLAARASRRLGVTEHATFSGALAWPYIYPWPQRPAGLVETAFDELARRWRPILDVFEENGVNACFEIHPGEDLHDGVTFEMFLERVGGHKRCNLLYDPSHFMLQQLDYLEYIDLYHDRIRVSRQGCRVQSDRQAGSVWRVPVVAQSRRPLPFPGRRSCELQGDLLEARAVRLSRLGGARVGVLHQAS